MGLSTLILGLIVFLVPHVFVTRRVARARLIERIGIGAYKIGFSVISAIGILLIRERKRHPVVVDNTETEPDATDDNEA